MRNGRHIAYLLAFAAGVAAGARPARADSDVAESAPAAAVEPESSASQPGTPAPVAASAPTPGAIAAQLLRDADKALERGDGAGARQLLEVLVREYPDTEAGREAARALRFADERRRAEKEPRPPPSTRPPTLVRLREPFSERTGERVNISGLEKTDFVATAFGYGLFAGALAGQAFNPWDDDELVAAATIGGGAAYLTGALLYLSLGKPDRADIPLMLGIASYVPVTAALMSEYVAADRGALKAIALSAIAALPIALVAGTQLDLDPGDTQLVRDAGFWGMALSLSAVAAAEGDANLALVGLVGLYGGLGLGLLAASATEFSLERVRVITMSGYAGAALGGMLGVLDGDGDTALGGMAAGAALGLLLTAAITGGIDEQMAPATARAVTPTVVAMRDSGSRTVVGLGLATTLE